MPTYTNDTGENLIVSNVQNDDGSTFVWRAGENFTTDDELNFPKVQSNAAKEAKKIAEKAAKEEAKAQRAAADTHDQERA